MCGVVWDIRTETNPLAEHLSVRNLDERDLVLRAESNNELLVSLLLAALVQDTHVGLAAVESLGGLTETTGETVVDEGDAQNTLEGVQDGHLAAAGIGRNLNLVGRGDGGCGLFSVRL
jgi:hypothetical protein